MPPTRSLAAFRDFAVGLGALGVLVYAITDALNLPTPANKRWNTKPGAVDPVDVIVEYGWLHKASDGQPVRPATREERDASAAARRARGGDGFFTYAAPAGPGSYGQPREIVIDGDPRYGPAATGMGYEAYFVDRFSDPNRSDVDDVPDLPADLETPAEPEADLPEPPPGVRLVDSLLDSTAPPTPPAPPAAEPWDDVPEPASVSQ